jgi:hypothetical protein
MSTRKITDLPKKSVSSEKAEDVKGGRKARKFSGSGGRSKKNSKVGGASKVSPFSKTR